MGSRRFLPRVALPAVLALVVWLVLRSIALSDETPAKGYIGNPIVAGGLPQRLATASKVQLFYLRDQLLPLWLSTDHSFDQVRLVGSLLHPAPLSFLALVAAAAVAAWRSFPRQPVVALCVLGYAIAFAPSCNFLFPIGTLMADRLAYVPSIFTCILAALLLALVRPPAARIAVAAAMAVLLSAASFVQARVWKDEITLFREQVTTAPRSAKSHQNYGYALHRRGELAAASAEYEQAIEIYPYWPEPYLFLGSAQDQLGLDPELRIATWSNAIPVRFRSMA
jgi:tetratricopeptide (TPR) repeat protein